MPVRFSCNNGCTGYIDLDFNPENIINIPEMNEIINIFEKDLERELNLKTIIIKSSRKGFFATGPSVESFKNIDKDGARYYVTVLNMLGKHIQESPVPVICAVDGLTTGSGLDIVSMADFVFATKNSSFADLSSKFGLFSPSSIELRLIFLAGARSSKEILFTAKEYSADEFHRLNLVNRVFENENALEKGLENFLEEFKSLSIDSIRTKKKLFTGIWKNFLKNSSISATEAFSELVVNGKDWGEIKSR